MHLGNGDLVLGQARLVVTKKSSSFKLLSSRITGKNSQPYFLSSKQIKHTFKRPAELQIKEQLLRVYRKHVFKDLFTGAHGQLIHIVRPMT